VNYFRVVQRPRSCQGQYGVWREVPALERQPGTVCPSPRQSMVVTGQLSYHR